MGGVLIDTNVVSWTIPTIANGDTAVLTATVAAPSVSVTAEAGDTLATRWTVKEKLDKVKAETGWDLKVSPDLRSTPPPNAEDLRILREKVDPHKIWSGGKRVVQQEGD